MCQEHLLKLIKIYKLNEVYSMIKPKKKKCVVCDLDCIVWSKGMCKACASATYQRKSYSPKRVLKDGKPMPEHTAIYMTHFGYSVGDTVISEISGLPSQDINHISPRGMGGSKLKDETVNLMALTRKEHDVFENYPEYKEWYKKVHLHFIATRKPYYITHPNDETLKTIIQLCQ